MGVRPAVLLSVVALLWASAAGAIQQVKSLYTAIDLDRCEPLETGSEALICAGLPGFPVYVRRDADKVYVSAGPDASRRRAADQTLGVVNMLASDGGRRFTVEWRFVVRQGRTVPYAMIVRYVTRQHERTGEVLVVTRIASDEVCQVATVDALANANAIVMAREAADTMARHGPCPKAVRPLGLSGRSPM